MHITNYRPEYSAVLKQWFENMASNYDQLCADQDDGIHSTVREARNCTIAHIEEDLEELKQLLEDVRRLPFTKLIDKHPY